MEYDIKDLSLKNIGREKIEWVKDFMPVLSSIEKKYIDKQPLKGIRVSMALHLEAKTAYLAIVMKNLGAEVRVSGSNPLSTQDQICAALVDMGISVFAYRGVDNETYNRHLVQALSHKPHIIIDDGADLAHALHKKHPELRENVYGGCEETTTGVIRLKAMDRQKILKYPMFAINDADCKHLFDNRFGTGQSSLEGVMRSTNLSLFGKKVVVAGFGWCGKGIAEKAKGFGANVIVTEVDAVKALEAAMEGYEVMPMKQAAKIGDIFITVFSGKCRNRCIGYFSYIGIICLYFIAIRDGEVLRQFQVEYPFKCLISFKVGYNSRFQTIIFLAVLTEGFQYLHGLVINFHIIPLLIHPEQQVILMLFFIQCFKNVCRIIPLEYGSERSNTESCTVVIYFFLFFLIFGAVYVIQSIEFQRRCM
jgi:hypothetical protein